VVGEWCAASGARHVVVADGPGWVDPHGIADVLLRADPAAQVHAWLARLKEATPATDGDWAKRWAACGRAARTAIDDLLHQATDVTEPGLAQAVADALPEGGNLVVSSSMPVRDLEWYVRPPSG